MEPAEIVDKTPDPPDPLSSSIRVSALFVLPALPRLSNVGPSSKSASAMAAIQFETGAVDGFVTGGGQFFSFR